MVNGGVYKMKGRQTNPVILRKLGLEALCKSLGPLGMVRFLQQYETGIGDYTKERDLWLKDIDVESIFIELKNRRKKKAR
jgi:CTP:molybdopterin cytidylyltransferase MocA